VPPGRRSHPLFARCYARISPAMDAGGMAGYRARALAGLAGSVIEVGAGNGLNFAHYPAGVTGVLAVEPDRYLRGIAEWHAGRAPVTVTVLDGVAERLPAADGSFDAAVLTLMLCSVVNQRAALAEVRRVVRPGGQLRFCEHVRAGTPGLRRVQRVLDATVWPGLGGGCHVARDTLAAIAGAGFTIVQSEAFQFPVSRIPAPASPHVWGIATRDPGPPPRQPV
jgi:ubiquinone/menaquinone biosynthesis C-methylase UbiE